MKEASSASKEKGSLPVVNVLTFTDTDRAQHGERVMRNLTAFPAFSASCFRAAASHSELLATKRRNCLGTDN